MPSKHISKEVEMAINYMQEAIVVSIQIATKIHAKTYETTTKYIVTQTAEETQMAAKHEEAIAERQQELDHFWGFISDNANLINPVQSFPDYLQHRTTASHNSYELQLRSFTHTHIYIYINITLLYVKLLHIYYSIKITN